MTGGAWWWVNDEAAQVEPGEGAPVSADLTALFERAAALHRDHDEPSDAIWSVLEELRLFGRAAFDAAVARLASGDPDLFVPAILADLDEGPPGPGVASRLPGRVRSP
jgi:hypothetical protein